MSETAPSKPRTTEAEGKPRRKGPPAWGIVIFLVLLGGMALINQCASTSGPEIEWIENDLEAALARVSDSKPRVFLYLYEQDDQTHQRNERRVFSQRWAREPLSKAVCCRIALRKDDRQSLKLRQEFVYKDTPLFLLLTKDRTMLRRTEGAVTEKMFFTDIAGPIEQSLKRIADRGDE
ncbi:MAG: hypothetical protein KAY37_16820 [Phycisphaerae bacterium]|nr:hypothetical protein [Phycisphaerae bacterium]